MGERAVSEANRDTLTAAASDLDVERRRIVDEIAAFEAFERRVRRIEPEQSPTDALANGGTVRGRRSAAGRSDRLEAVQSAYEETVMSVPHYAEDYGDSYAESVEAEFGTTLAVALVHGPEFTRRSRSLLLSAVDDARTGRESMQEMVDRERERVRSASETLRDVEQTVSKVEEERFDGASFGALDAYRARLCALEARCEETAERRQETIAEIRKRKRVRVETDYLEYVYRRLDVEYPILAACTSLLVRIDDRRTDVEREMAVTTA